MFERLRLWATEGELKGRSFVLENDSTCILGRSEECSLQFPDIFSLVSRFHCRISLSAPLAYIQDLGSLNGTYVNDAKIGQRRKGQLWEDVVQAKHEEHLLSDGDELRIGSHVFRVEFSPPDPYVEAEVCEAEELKSGGCASCC